MSIRPTRRDTLRAAALFALSGDSLSAQSRTSSLVYPSPETGKLHYAADEHGNRIPDFSSAGYMGGGFALPDAPVQRFVPAETGDATERIQQAIDEVSAREIDERGLRGAVLLGRGAHEIHGRLCIRASGVVLRGEANSEDGTVLIGMGRQQRALVNIEGSAGRTTSAVTAVKAEYAPVGERSIEVASVNGLRTGQTVIVRRTGNADWIRAIGMDKITPRPGDPSSTVQWQPFNLDFERRIVEIDGSRVVLDAPITCAIESRWGGGQILGFDESSRLFNVGVESIRAVSDYDRSVRKTLNGESYAADERHAWSFVSIAHANNVWVRDLVARQFGFACVDIGRARWVTVQDCDNGEMVSEITGSRRYPFNVNGQLCLVQRCTSDTGRHDFVVGARVCGPNVFLYCKAGRSFATSEPHHRWSVGGLYDSVRAPIAFQDRQYYGTGHGWSGANYVAWNCEGSLVCQRPPTAQNWAIGQVGQKAKGAFEPRPDGWWESHGQHVTPDSLYLTQLKDRLGQSAVENLGWRGL